MTDSPGLQHFGRPMAVPGALMGPGDEGTGGLGAEEAGGRGDADATEVEAVGVPAGGEGRVVGDPAVGVEEAGLEEEVEASVVEVDERAPERAGELAAAQAVVRVVMLVD